MSPRSAAAAAVLTSPAKHEISFSLSLFGVSDIAAKGQVFSSTPLGVSPNDLLFLAISTACYRPFNSALPRGIPLISTLPQNSKIVAYRPNQTQFTPIHNCMSCRVGRCELDIRLRPCLCGKKKLRISYTEEHKSQEPTQPQSVASLQCRPTM